MCSTETKQLGDTVLEPQETIGTLVGLHVGTKDRPTNHRTFAVQTQREVRGHRLHHHVDPTSECGERNLPNNPK